MKLTDRFYKRMLLLFLSGILTGLTVAFPKIGIFEWLTLVPLSVFLLEVCSDKEVKLPALYGYGLFFFTSFYIVIFHWFVNLYPLEFIDGMTKSGAIAVVLSASVGLSLFQAVQGALVFPLLAILLRTRLLCKFPALRPLTVALTWAVYEWTQTIGWWGVPWGRLAIGQSELVVGLQTASLFGSYFVSFVIVFVNAYLAFGLIALISAPAEIRKQDLKLTATFCLAALLLQYGAGLYLYAENAPKETDKRVNVAVIQGNIPSGEKWDASTSEKTLNVYRDYTEKAAKEGAAIVVFPETALPWTVKKGNPRYEYLSDLAKTNNVTILAGAFTTDNDRNEYNSIVCFTPDGEMSETIYNKRRLVPFGEFVPWRVIIETLVPPLADLVMSGGEVARGEGSNIFELEEANIGSLVCFDSIYEELTLESVRDGAELICLSTNDSWFTDSAALYMHNAQAMLRAIECGRYVARAANTGISTIINSRGEVEEWLEPLVDGMIVKEVAVRSHRTLYSYIGNLFVYLSITVLAGLIILDAFIKIKSHKLLTKQKKSNIINLDQK